MKKSIYYTGIACAILMLLGSLFKIQHWPGAGVMLVLAVMLFCFFFLPLALVNSYREGERKYRALHMVTFVVFFVSMMGVIFKVQHWPGAGALLPFGITLPFVLFLPVYLYQTRHEKEKNTVNFSAVMFGLTFLAVFSVMLALNISKNVLSGIGRNVAMNQETAEFYRSAGKKSRAGELYNYIESLKSSLLAATGNQPLNKGKMNVADMVNLENANAPEHLLLGEENNGKLPELKLKMSAYRKALAGSGKISPELAELADTLLDVSDKETEEGKQSWEQRTFPSYQLIVVLDALTRIQRNVCLLESELLAER